MPEEQDLELGNRLERAIGDATVPRFYLNGFACAQTNADVVIIGECHNKPALVLSLSFTTAKTLAQSLAGIISNLEVTVGREMLTTQDIERAMTERKVQ